MDFNPRSREGSDLVLVDKAADSKISIHAPVRGATGGRYRCGAHDLHFNPRSREGSDDYRRPECHRAGDFNPRSREGSDEAEASALLNDLLFQSTLP